MHAPVGLGVAQQGARPAVTYYLVTTIAAKLTLFPLNTPEHKREEEKSTDDDSVFCTWSLQQTNSFTTNVLNDTDK